MTRSQLDYEDYESDEDEGSEGAEEEDEEDGEEETFEDAMENLTISAPALVSASA